MTENKELEESDRIRGEEREWRYLLCIPRDWFGVWHKAEPQYLLNKLTRVIYIDVTAEPIGLDVKADNIYLLRFKGIPSSL